MLTASLCAMPLTLASCGTEAETVDISAPQEVEVNENSESVTSYSLDSAQSTFTWEANKIVGGHVGTMTVYSGSVQVDNGQPVGGNFTIDMESITENENNQAVIDHLKNEDFFNVSVHPESSFEITSVEAITPPDENGNTHMITGNLKIKDQFNSITFPAAVNITDSQITADANFNINRLDWGMEFRSASLFTEFGDNAIKDEVNFDLNLVFTK